MPKELPRLEVSAWVVGVLGCLLRTIYNSFLRGKYLIIRVKDLVEIAGSINKGIKLI